MKIILTRQDTDERVEYYVDETKVLDFVHESMLEKVETPMRLPGGPTIDLTKRSLLSTALRQVCAMGLIPLLTWTAQKYGVMLPEKERHGDAIRYSIDAYVRITKKMLYDTQLVLEDEPYIDDMRTITHIDAEKEESTNPLAFLMLSGKDLPNGGDDLS